MTDKGTIGQGMVAFRLPADLAWKLDRLAQQTDRSRSTVLRQLLRRASAGQPDVTLNHKQDART